jgi:hypothetical protein
LAQDALPTERLTQLFAQQSPVSPPQPARQENLPDAEQIVLLLRNTLITLNDALLTGNFTVLRDRGAPDFRDANSSARLSLAFSDLASKRVDLSSVAIITPQLTTAPSLDRMTGILRLKGYFPGQPIKIDFEILYPVVDGHWRLFALSVQPSTSARPATTPRGKDGATDSKDNQD